MRVEHKTGSNALTSSGESKHKAHTSRQAANRHTSTKAPIRNMSCVVCWEDRHAVVWGEIHYNTIQNDTIQYNTRQDKTIQYITIQYGATQNDKVPPNDPTGP